MYIKHIRINNFRGIKNGDFQFHEGMNILIGSSNVGKSTILTAIDFVLNPNHSWWRRDTLNELDFYLKDTDEPIVIEMLLGCGSYKCIDKGKKCPRFDVGAEETCKLANKLIFVDRESQEVLKADDEEIENSEQVETCVLLQMKAEYQASEGYVEVTHSVLNADKEIWSDLTRPMKEWIGSLLFVSGANPSSDCRLQYNSLLTRAMGDISEWEQEYLAEFKSKLKEKVELLSEGHAKGVLKKFETQSSKLSPILEGSPSLGIEGTEKRDLLRQVELCFKTTDCELPLSRYGRGMQNMASMIMATLAQSTARKSRPPVSIVMIEEPEQNLEPQLQRSILRFICSLLEESDNRQIIVTTHSPYIVSSDLKLGTVIKINESERGEIAGIFLDNIEGAEPFDKIRKRVENDSELFESLFANLVIVWEGASEAGLYNAIMRSCKDFPAEMLTGVEGRGSTVLAICEWFKNSGYDVIAVIDSDISDPKKLYDAHIPFISLPKGMKIEEVLADIIIEIGGEDAAKILLRTIGTYGEINKTMFEGHKDWANLKAVFASDNKGNEWQTDEVLDSFIYSILPNRDAIITYLIECKGRNHRDVLGEELVINHWDKLGIIKLVVEKLKEIWFERSKLGKYQFTEKGELKPYNPE